MNLTLIRHAYLHECTLGRLYAGDLRLATLEEPWRPNPHGPGGQPRTSCVPDGQYELRPHISQRYSAGVWALVNPALGVWYQPDEIPPGQKWGRSAVLIHAGNTTADTEGCVLVGLAHATNMVTSSRVALEQLRGVLGTRETHRLTIRPIAGTSELAA
jgi:hypothetical protein